MILIRNELGNIDRKLIRDYVTFLREEFIPEQIISIHGYLSERERRSQDLPTLRYSDWSHEAEELHKHFESLLLAEKIIKRLEHGPD